jgi:hypothetical protein
MIYNIHVDNSLNFSRFDDQYSTIVEIGGAEDWTMTIPNSLSGHGGFTIQANNSNMYSIGPTMFAEIAMSTPFKREGHGQHTELNSSFSSNWVSVTSIADGVTFISLAELPIRYARLSGSFTGSNSAFIAYVFSTNCINRSF